jgi:hypothetical protein
LQQDTQEKLQLDMQKDTQEKRTKTQLGTQKKTHKKRVSFNKASLGTTAQFARLFLSASP